LTLITAVVRIVAVRRGVVPTIPFLAVVTVIPFHAAVTVMPFHAVVMAVILVYGFIVAIFLVVLLLAAFFVIASLLGLASAAHDLTSLVLVQLQGMSGGGSWHGTPV
jgi:hypothetical protein